MSGILNKFRRFGRSTLPSPPANFLADFASGSLHLFSQILAALHKREPNTTLDVSLTHSTLYLSQLELLKEISVGSLTRSKPKDNVPINTFTRPHELIFSDISGTRFVLKPGTKIFEEMRLLFFNDEESEEGKIIGDIM
jgi:crotonobetainyl-CoA:carnitine CoA-transferase CaiB-like acyl-CoA transferase